MGLGGLLYRLAKIVGGVHEKMCCPAVLTIFEPSTKRKFTRVQMLRRLSIARSTRRVRNIRLLHGSAIGPGLVFSRAIFVLMER
jgi:hypothetical protein